MADEDRVLLIRFEVPDDLTNEELHDMGDRIVTYLDTGEPVTFDGTEVAPRRVVDRMAVHAQQAAEVARLRAEVRDLTAARDAAMTIFRGGLDSAPATRTFDLLGQIEDALAVPMSDQPGVGDPAGTDEDVTARLDRAATSAEPSRRRASRRGRGMMFHWHRWEEIGRRYQPSPIIKATVPAGLVASIAFGRTTVELKCVRCGLVRATHYVGDSGVRRA